MLSARTLVLSKASCQLVFSICFVFWTCSVFASEQNLFDLESIRDTSTLEIELLQDWRPSPKRPAMIEKLIEITVCEWWQGQKVRLPVTFVVPKDGLPCRNVIVANQGLALQMGRPTEPQWRLAEKHGVGIVLIGMGTIDAMSPKGQLHHGMKAQLLQTKNVRYTPAWIWGMSQMRALTAAASEPGHFRPQKVLATGGSKRGVASSVAGIFDDRFTAIMPVVAPMLGNPGGITYVTGDEPRELLEIDRQFYSDLADGKLEADPTAEKALRDRAVRRATQRITLQQTIDADWSPSDRRAITDRVWEACLVTKHFPRIKDRGLEFFFNVGTNDSVTPALRKLGERYPNFPVCIIPGGQHGGPAGAGYTRQVPKLPEVEQNFYSFARYHFFSDRSFPRIPQIRGAWDSQRKSLSVNVVMPPGILPEQNEVWWSVDRSEPYTLPFEYDRWESMELKPTGGNVYRATIVFSQHPERVDFLSLHRHSENGLPMTFSSPYTRVTPQVPPETP